MSFWMQWKVGGRRLCIPNCYSHFGVFFAAMLSTFVPKAGETNATATLPSSARQTFRESQKHSSAQSPLCGGPEVLDPLQAKDLVKQH